MQFKCKCTIPTQEFQTWLEFTEFRCVYLLENRCKISHISIITISTYLLNEWIDRYSQIYLYYARINNCMIVQYIILQSQPLRTGLTKMHKWTNKTITCALKILNRQIVWPFTKGSCNLILLCKGKDLFFLLNCWLNLFLMFPIIMYSTSFNPFPPRPAIILLCIMQENFTHQGRASGWERVSWAYLLISLL